MGNCLFGYPVYSDPNTIYAPTFAGGSWLATGDIALANLQDRRMSKVARSTDAKLQSTRFSFDLKAARRVGVIAIPSHTLSRAAKIRLLAQTSTLVVDYEAGDDLSLLTGVFTRASVATYVDAQGVVRTAAANVVRDGHYIGGLRHTLHEKTRTNSWTWSEDLTNAVWSQNAVTSTATGVGPDGGATSATKVREDSSALRHRIARSWLAPTANTTQAFQFFAKAVERTAITVTTTDLAGTQGNFTVNLLTGAVSGAAGTIAAANVQTTVLGTGYVWIRFTQSSGTGASSPAFYVELLNGGTSTYQGDGVSGVMLWGFDWEKDQPFSSSYKPTTAAAFTRVSELLSGNLPAGFTPQALTAQMRYVDLGGQSVGTSAAPSLFTLGSWGAAGGDSLTMYYVSDIAESAAKHNGTAQVNNGSINTGILPGDVVDARLTMTSAGVTQSSTSRNGAAEVPAGVSAGQALMPAWSAQTWQLGSRAGTSQGFIAIRSFRIAADVQSMAYMQAAVYDSGWLDVWPVVYPAGSLTADDPRMVDGKYSAEEVVGFNIGFVHLPPAAITFRYGSIQISDEGNAALYVDLGRLMVCGSYQPSLNMIYGAKLGLTTESTRIVTDGGAASYNEKPTARYQAFSMESLPEDELLVNLFDLMRRVGITKQFFYVHDPADTYHMHRRSFACVMRELSALEYPSYKRGTQPIAVIEDL